MNRFDELMKAVEQFKASLPAFGNACIAALEPVREASKVLIAALEEAGFDIDIQEESPDVMETWGKTWSPSVQSTSDFMTITDITDAEYEIIEAVPALVECIRKTISQHDLPDSYVDGRQVETMAESVQSMRILLETLGIDS